MFDKGSKFANFLKMNYKCITPDISTFRKVRIKVGDLTKTSKIYPYNL